MTSRQFTENLHKPILRKLEKRKVSLSLKDNILASDLAVIQLLSK